MREFIVLMPLSVPSRNLREKREKMDYRIELELAQRGLRLGEVLVMPCSFRRKAVRQRAGKGCSGGLWSLHLWRHPGLLPRLGHHQQLHRNVSKWGSIQTDDLQRSLPILIIL